MTTRPKIKVASIINGKYLAFRKLGEGGCGSIYEVALVKCPQKRFACKAETTVPDEDPTLPMEHKVIQLLNERNSQHSVELLEKGKGENYQFLVMTLLGPSLDAIRATLPLKKFSTFSTLVVIIQALDSLKELHDIGFIHRDVKPANFAIGTLGTPKQRLLHVLDFGIARQYVTKTEDGRQKMRRQRKIVPFRGTLRYCSVATQERKEQGRHDDLWSLFYMLVEFSKGSLPWEGLTDEEELRKLKSDMQELTNGLDEEYANMKVDWEHGGRFEHYFEKKTATLPTVTEKDMTNVELEKLLAVPEKVVKVTLEKIKICPSQNESREKQNHANRACKIYRVFTTTIPSRQHAQKKVAQQESRWKQKAEVEKKERLAKKIEAQRRAKEDVVVPEEIATEMKKRK
ncbi:unnamed protein product [Caenorhabditis angaria]|uniref:Protein kinase domain-containing protein n=1 Tax=Caenorhabditis angaria TaxID=860376 RepID=A0A9P1I9B7_9PELO|nr:unnamed protein product [Caenorhabditis angaria]